MLKTSKLKRISEYYSDDYNHNSDDKIYKVKVSSLGWLNLMNYSIKNSEYKTPDAWYKNWKFLGIQFDRSGSIFGTEDALNLFASHAEVVNKIIKSAVTKNMIKNIKENKELV